MLTPEDTNGDIEAAATLLREKGIAKAAKKSGQNCSSSLVVVRLLFVKLKQISKNNLHLIEGLGNLFIESNVASVEEAALKDASGKTVEEVVLGATATIGEKISLRL